MKSKKVPYCVLVCLFACPALATYTYTITEYQSLPDLHDNQSMLVKDNGGGGLITLIGDSLMRVDGTSALKEGYGGIWEIRLGGYSHLGFSGGEMHLLNIGNYVTATLSGGRIDNIYSYQAAWKYAGDPPVKVSNPHIEIVCDLGSVNYDTVTKKLTGSWLDGIPFSIQLIDVSGYSPAIENIFFTPEPATLCMMAAGALLLRRRHV